MGLIQSLFGVQNLSPHGFCLLWDPALIWLHVSSDFVIGSAYFSIALVLAYIVSKRSDIAFGWIFWMFSAFIVACGATHLFNIWTLWHADYGIEGVVKFVTAIASIATAIVMWPLLPRVMALPSPAQLRQVNEALSYQVRERTTSLEALRRTEARNWRLYQNTPVPIQSTDHAMRLVDVNARWLDLLGYARDAVLGRKVTDFMTQDTAREHRDVNFPILLGGGEVHGRRYEFVRENGEVVSMLYSARVEGDPQDGSFQTFGVLVDITARLQAERALQQSERRFRLVFEAAPNAMAMISRSGKIVLVNTQVERDFGYSRDELVGQPIEMLVPERFRGRHQGLREGFFADSRSRLIGATHGLHGRRKDGSEFPVEIGLNPIDTDEGTMVLSSIVDITERMARDRALRESERRYSLLVNGVTDYAVYMLDPNGMVTNWNKGAERIKGYRTEEIVGQHYSCFYTEEDRAANAPQHALEIAARDGRHEEEGLHVRKDGTRFWASAVIDALRDDDNQLIGFAKITRDITERIEAERALRESELRYRERAELLLHESERRYKHIFNTVSVAIWEDDISDIKTAIDSLKAQGVEDFGQYLASRPASVQELLSMMKIVDANEAALELFGARSNDELSASLDKIFLPEAQEVFVGELIAIAEGRSSFESEATFQTLSGSKLMVLYRITFPPNVTTLNRVLVSITDITHLRRAQESLQQAQEDLARVNRVMLLGEMTASIAHEVNQPITATVTNASAGLRWLSAQPPETERARQALERIVRDGHRAGEVIDRIRALVKKVPPRRDRLDINEAILEVIAMTQSDLQRNRVRLRTRLTSDLPFVPADRVQLQQVILNLVVNGMEAMSGVDDRPRELIVGSGRTDSNGVFVEVRDSGLGLDPANLGHLFRSFYTTKSNGMGMGLAISRSIVEAHGGRLWAEPNTPYGAVFQFTLSANEESSTEPMKLAS